MGMLRFSEPLTPAAAEILRCCLELSADLARDDALGDEWPLTYPLAARCFTAKLARDTLLDLLGKLPRPQLYAPTTYHELLMYECLEVEIACFNDGLLPGLFDTLKGLAEARDASYLHFLPGPPGQEGGAIDFHAFIDAYFWDTDFLLEPSTFEQMDARLKERLGYRADLFGVLSGLTPHPAELVLKRCDAFEATDASDAGADRG
jgi:hypothetical protein